MLMQCQPNPTISEGFRLLEPQVMNSFSVVQRSWCLENAEAKYGQLIQVFTFHPVAGISVFARSTFTFKNIHAAIFLFPPLLVGAGFPVGSVFLPSSGPGGSSQWKELCWGKLILDWPGMGQVPEESQTWASSQGIKNSGTPGKGRLSSDDTLDNSVCEPNKWESGNRMFFCVPY